MNIERGPSLHYLLLYYTFSSTSSIYLKTGNDLKVFTPALDLLTVPFLQIYELKNQKCDTHLNQK